MTHTSESLIESHNKFQYGTRQLQTKRSLLDCPWLENRFFCQLTFVVPKRLPPNKPSLAFDFWLKIKQYRATLFLSLIASSAVILPSNISKLPRSRTFSDIKLTYHKNAPDLHNYHCGMTLFAYSLSCCDHLFIWNTFFHFLVSTILTSIQLYQSPFAISLSLGQPSRPLFQLQWLWILVMNSTVR